MLPLAPILEKATRAQRGEARRALEKTPRTRKRILRMAERALARADETIAQAAEAVPPPRPIACGADCPYCCHIRLTASAPEILLVLEHIHTAWDDAARAALARKVKNTDTFTRGKGDDARGHMRLPCPLLKDGSCAVHAVRPLSCRGLASVDVGACKAAYRSRMATGVPVFDPQHQAANAVGYGLYAGLADAGVPVENIELVAALAIGLADRNVARRWLDGADPFASARTVAS